ncbi:hypothetical protein [Mesorhizobium sp. SP-1A]|uniref:hypothetical protein n=1 Tax=Mesorhizobium sp. SP-1A TaxID=3077840 RepID=UPI0028F6ED39|nr:hypothetical protein [Mesorhizobium sp. SP-1A]
MSRALLIEQPLVSEKMPSEQSSDAAKVAISRLLEIRRNSAEKMSEAIDGVSEKLHKATKELIEERTFRSSAELEVQNLSAQLNSLKQKYAELHEGLVKVLTLKFPGESELSLETRLESFLLASNSGAEVGNQPNLTSPKSISFLNLIEDSLN